MIKSNFALSKSKAEALKKNHLKNDYARRYLR
jgi:hypothetical protein